MYTLLFRHTYLLILFLCLCIVITGSAAETTVHFIDVGSGDAVLLQSGDETVLIDAGADRNSTAGYLQNHNITDIDQFLVTSMSPDKTAGILEVMNRTMVHNYRDYGNPGGYPSYNKVTSRISNESIPASPLLPGEIIPFGTNGIIEVLAKNESTPSRYDEAVLKIAIGDISMLLMSKDGTPDISLDEPVRIVRAADHGSRDGYNARFIHDLKPEVGIISVGREGKGPNEATIMGFEAAGAEVYRTDSKGTIIIRTDGTTYTIGSSRSSPSGSISLISVIETRPPQ